MKAYNEGKVRIRHIIIRCFNSCKNRSQIDLYIYKKVIHYYVIMLLLCFPSLNIYSSFTFNLIDTSARKCIVED